MSTNDESIRKYVIDDLLVELDEAILKCSTQSIKEFSGLLQNNEDLSNRVFHIKVEQFRQVDVDYASKFALDRIYRHLERKELGNL